MSKYIYCEEKLSQRISYIFFVYVCVYVCVYIYAYVYIYVCVCVHWAV